MHHLSRFDDVPLCEHLERVLLPSLQGCGQQHAPKLALAQRARDLEVVQREVLVADALLYGRRHVLVACLHPRDVLPQQHRQGSESLFEDAHVHPQHRDRRGGHHRVLVRVPHEDRLLPEERPRLQPHQTLGLVRPLLAAHHHALALLDHVEAVRPLPGSLPHNHLPLLEVHHVHALGDGVDEAPLQGDEEGPRAQQPAPLAPPRIQEHLIEVDLGQQQTLHLCFGKHGELVRLVPQKRPRPDGVLRVQRGQLLVLHLLLHHRRIVTTLRIPVVAVGLLLLLHPCWIPVHIAAVSSR
mmetsp:Transcript_236/g.407  ORF Transcript_236/g.407 Transcript_236/m.407 type:complete len:297 (-) Transcript_236:1929-2819(-)